jgi:hypothetical protein
MIPPLVIVGGSAPDCPLRKRQSSLSARRTEVGHAAAGATIFDRLAAKSLVSRLWIKVNGVLRRGSRILSDFAGESGKASGRHR